MIHQRFEMVVSKNIYFCQYFSLVFGKQKHKCLKTQQYGF